MNIFKGIIIIATFVFMIGGTLLAVHTAITELDAKFVKDPETCFTEFKVEEARRDSNELLWCKVNNKWIQSTSGE